MHQTQDSSAILKTVLIVPSQLCEMPFGCNSSIPSVKLNLIAPSMLCQFSYLGCLGGWHLELHPSKSINQTTTDNNRAAPGASWAYYLQSSTQQAYSFSPMRASHQTSPFVPPINTAQRLLVLRTLPSPHALHDPHLHHCCLYRQSHPRRYCTRDPRLNNASLHRHCPRFSWVEADSMADVGL